MVNFEFNPIKLLKIAKKLYKYLFPFESFISFHIHVNS